MRGLEEWWSGLKQISFVGERDLAEGAGVMVSKGGVRTVT